MTERCTTDEVLATIALDGIDNDGIFSSEWCRMIEKHDMSVLIKIICKNRKEPSFAPLISFLNDCIESEQDNLFGE
jgi:hypothetical protein